MFFLQERDSRRFFLFLMGSVVAFLFFAFLLSWLHGTEMQNLLYENEQRITASLLEQGVASTEIATALKQSASSEDGAALLRKIGHTKSVSFWMIPETRRLAVSFAQTACSVIAAAGTVLILYTVHFLRKREKTYQDAVDIITQFSDGNFENHLPQNENGTLYGLFASVEKLAMALQAQNEKGQQTKEFLKTTILDISHQLKTPLAALNMYTEIIANEPENVETVRDFSGKSMQSLGRMEQLIQMLLKVTRLDAGSVVFHQSVYSVKELIFRAAEDFFTRAEAEGKKLVVEGDTSETLRCDIEWTSEAIGNLIKNALDHTDRGDTISIGWTRSPAMIQLSVSDDGEGIEAEDLHHIFKRFYRSKHSRNRQGAGLGLPLAKAIIEGQNGMLSVCSTPGKGSAFTISFLTDL